MAERKDSSAQTEKLQALEAARLQIEKQFGQGSMGKTPRGCQAKHRLPS